MDWIKRNLFFTIGGVVALALLGAAGFYFYVGWRHNAAAFVQLSEIYIQLITATAMNPAQGNDRGNNIQAANEQTAQIRQWIRQARKYFVPISPITATVNGLVNGKGFADALPRTIAQLQREANDASVQVPPDYKFSFTAESGVVLFPPGSLGPLSQQLGEVKTISEILFSAGINALESIQRVSVSGTGQSAGPQSDYLNAWPVTNSLAIITPYQVTFRSFTPEIAKVIQGFATPPQAFIIRTVAVQPATAAGFGEGGFGAPGYGYTPGGYGGYGVPGYGMRGGYGGEMPAYAPPGYGPPGGMAGQPGTVVPSQGGLQTILDEQLLRITMEVDVVKLLPGD